MQRYDVTILLYSILICCVHQPLSCSSQQPHSLCIFSFRQGRRSRTKTDIIVHKTVTTEITHHRMSMLNSHDEDGKKARSSQVLEVGDDNNPSHLEKGLATMAQDSTFSGEPEDDLWWLELLFGLCFLPTKKRSSRGWRYLNVFYCLCSTFVSCGSTIYVSLNPHNHGSLMSSLGLVWALNVMFVYLYLSYSQRQSPDLIDKLRSISKSPLHPQLLKQPTDFTRVCKIPVLITIFVWILNVCVTLFRIRAVVMSNFGLSDNIYFIVFVAYLSLHISFLCWYLPIPIVYTGCYYLGRRVEAMHNVVVNEFAKDENVNFITLTDMYAELFSLNLTLNSCISLLFSFVTILLAVFLFFMIFVTISGATGEVGIVWGITNGCLVACLCFPVAYLELFNKKLSFILGDFPVHKNTSVQALLQFQALRVKSLSCPFGIRVYGSLYVVSFSTIATVSSVWGSIFVFLLGSSMIQSRE